MKNHLVKSHGMLTRHSKASALVLNRGLAKENTVPEVAALLCYVFVVVVLLLACGWCFSVAWGSVVFVALWVLGWVFFALFVVPVFGSSLALALINL
ncbi:hypothetical protein Q3G72_022591 [Acer saccharum]|nr:hypothetical protein Q3G72_022591 [Acer saccharum]